MQRSITYQANINKFGLLLLFVLYESLNSIYLFLPPLFGILLFIFAKSLKSENSYSIAFILIALLIFEADKGYYIFSSIIYFLIVYKLIMPKLMQSSSCASCIKLSYILLAYLGFYFFNIFLANFLMIDVPSIDYYVIYYILIEFLIVSIL